MYAVGQLIVYGSTGVCRVEAVEVPQNIPSADKSRLYYRLKPLYDAGVIYTPVDTTVFMRPVVSRERAEQLIRSIPSIRPAPCDSHSPQILGDHYKTFFRSHRCEDLMQLIKTVYCKSRLSPTGRAISKTDQHYLKRAEELLYNEFSVALEMPADQVKPYIEHCLGGFDAVDAALPVQ